MSCAKIVSNRSFFTRAMNPVRTSSIAPATTVLAAEPPEHSTLGSRAAYISAPVMGLLGVVTPLSTDSGSIYAASTWRRMARSGLPMARMSLNVGECGLALAWRRHVKLFSLLTGPHPSVHPE